MTSLRNMLAETTENMFFIVGPGRAGTTLLQAMLTSHSRITIPPETQFFSRLWTRRGRFGDIKQERNMRRLVTFIQSPSCVISMLGLQTDMILGAFCKTNRTYGDLLVVILTLYGKARSKPHVGEKSPDHVFYMPLIAEIFPKAKFITVLRDPRAVASSERKTPWGSRSVHQITKRWRRATSICRKMESVLSSKRCIMIRYEDLVMQPEETLRRVCNFLREEYEPAMLDYFKRPSSELGFGSIELSWKNNTLKPLNVRRIEAWQKELTKYEIEIIDRTAREHLEYLGYRQMYPYMSGYLRYAFNLLKDRLAGYAATLTGARELYFKRPSGLD